MSTQTDVQRPYEYQRLWYPETEKVLTFADFLRETAPSSRFTFTDIFCGAGGSSIGLALAGGVLKVAANHWKVAIETHGKNFADADHLCADVSNYDMRRLPRTDLLWASPICTEISPAGARRRKKAQLDLFEEEDEAPVDQDAFIRTRATFMDVIRAMEVKRYKAVIVENVVNVATDWELFDWWCSGVRTLDYNIQFVSVNSAHVGGEDNPAAPQWRDRLYLVITRKDIPLPDVEPRPLAWCAICDEDVHAVQSWRKDDGRGRQVGKYGSQYDYVCPNAHRHPKKTLVEPYVLPAAAAINWADLGVKIGERAEHKLPALKPNTLRKIQLGLDTFGTDPVMVTLTHGQNADGRPYPATSAPLPTRTIKIGDGVAVPPGYLVPSGGTWRTEPTALHQPMPTRTTRDNDALVVPPFVTVLRNHGGARRADETALTTVSAGGNHHGLALAPGAEYAGVEQVRNTLVIPYRRGAKPHRTDRPVSTIATHDAHGLARLDVDINDVRYRMLQPREQLRAQRFPDVYEVTGTKGDQTMQAGNAVSSNVAKWLGDAVAKVL
uniref:DNA cytosine methyltransferase n=1 Tax=Amycolatopsis sp. CA-290885 TaxID=3239925 RepID=UPI003F496B8F